MCLPLTLSCGNACVESGFLVNAVILVENLVVVVEVVVVHNDSLIAQCTVYDDMQAVMLTRQQSSRPRPRHQVSRPRPRRQLSRPRPRHQVSRPRQQVLRPRHQLSRPRHHTVNILTTFLHGRCMQKITSTIYITVTQ